MVLCYNIIDIKEMEKFFMNRERFSEICLRYRDRIRERSVIGTLSEKTLHAILKDYFESNSEYQEVKINGYFADVARAGEIYEIQTRDLYRLSPKISTFIVENRVTVVYPVSLSKKIFWMDSETGECLSQRKSSKKEKEIDVLAELYGLREFLLHERFRVCLLLLEVNEYRIPDGQGKDKKKRATKLDRYPTALVDEIYLETAEDYLRFLPKDLPEIFTSAEFSRIARCRLFVAQRALNILTKLGLLQVIGKDGRRNQYKILDFS